MVADCRHHWVIDTPHGPTSMGVCLLCKTVKEFRNSKADDKGALVTKSVALTAAQKKAVSK